MQAIAASKAAKEMARAFKRELERQRGYTNQAYDVFQPATARRGVETAREEIGKGRAKREAFYQKTASSPLGIGGGPSDRDKAAYALAGANRGQLGGYSDWALDRMIDNIRTQDELNKITNFATGTAQVFPYRLYDAQHSQDELAFWGNLISSIGGSAANYGQLFGGGVPAQTPAVGSSQQSLFGAAPVGDIDPAYYNLFQGQA